MSSGLSLLSLQSMKCLDLAGKLAGALLGMKTAEGRHETLLAMLRTSPAASLMPVLLLLLSPKVMLKSEASKALCLHC